MSSDEIAGEGLQFYRGKWYPSGELVEMIDREIGEIIAEGHRRCERIAAGAMETFAADYSRIKSPRMRKSVLENLKEPSCL